MITDNGTTTRQIDVITSSELVSKEDAVQGVQFTATEDMGRYICVVHPLEMVGDIEVATDGGGGAGNKTGTANNSSQ